MMRTHFSARLKLGLDSPGEIIVKGMSIHFNIERITGMIDLCMDVFCSDFASCEPLDCLERYLLRTGQMKDDSHDGTYVTYLTVQ
jgi:hypothetical protein